MFYIKGNIGKGCVLASVDEFCTETILNAHLCFKIHKINLKHNMLGTINETMLSKN